MTQLRQLGAMMAAAVLVAAPAMAQEAPRPVTQDAPRPAAVQDAPKSAPATSSPPAVSTAPPSKSSSPTGVVATTNNPNLAVATLRLESGVRVSKIIGEAVQNERNQRVGTVDDLILSPQNTITMAIVSVGGFLGMGSKLVAVPWDQLTAQGDHLVLPGASKQRLNAAPSFQY